MPHPLPRRLCTLAGACLVALLGAGTAAPAAPAATRAATVNDAFWPKQWGLRNAGGTRLWRWGHGSPRTVVAVLDTGVDAGHPDLHGAVVPGWNTLAGSADTHDDNGHGTLVAGIIAARAGNRTGIAGYCWSCSIMPVKVLDGAGQGSGPAIAAGITWAVAHGAAIVNMSFTLDQPDTAVEAAVANAISRHVIVVTAAGNAGGDGVTYPAALGGVLSAGGVDPAGALYSWSTFGPWTTASMPGCNETTSLGDWYTQFCGSSSAAAALSGLLALAASDAPHARGRLAALLRQHVATPRRRVDAAGFLAAAAKLERSLSRR
jgi:thermitase